MIKLILMAFLTAMFTGCGTKILSRKSYEYRIITAYQMGVKAGVELPFSKCQTLRDMEKLGVR